MTLRSILLISMLAVGKPLAASFNDLFIDRTMRLDYFHTGGKGTEIVSLDQVVSDGKWAGSQTQLVDNTNLGKYYFEIIDVATNQVLYSRGFANIFGEWEATPESKERYRTFHESLRFPWPKKPVTVVLKKRDTYNVFNELWSTVVDPNSRFVNTSTIAALGQVRNLVINGPSSQKADLLLISEGYTAKEMPKFRKDAKRLVNKLFLTEPFKSRKTDFNVRLLEIPSARSGVHRPRTGDSRRTPLMAEYNIFDSERYLLTLDNKALRNAASAAPYEFVEILVNEKQYGGGGVFNDQATTSVDTAFAEYVFVHEFAHHFAALADEYYTSDVAQETGAPEKMEPWEPNVTAMKDAKKLKWGDLVDAGTPLPTPWEKQAYEKHSLEIQKQRRAIRERNAPESEMNQLFRRQQKWETTFLSSMKYAGKVGAFEGAAYEQNGLYRSETDCMMFTRDDVGFCKVCSRAIERIIDLYAK